MSVDLVNIAEQLRKLNPWHDPSWPEVLKAAADVIDAQAINNRELLDALQRNLGRLEEIKGALCAVKDGLIEKNAEIERLKQERRMRH